MLAAKAALLFTWGQALGCCVLGTQILVTLLRAVGGWLGTQWEGGGFKRASPFCPIPQVLALVSGAIRVAGGRDWFTHL